MLPQVRASTTFSGLAHWHPELCPHKELWHSWKTWPHLNLSQDQGSDDRSGVMALCYHEPVRINATLFWDTGHDSWRDTLAMIKKSGNYSFVILALAAANRLHDPQESDSRYHQCKEAMKSHFNISTPVTSPLFREYAGARTLWMPCGSIPR